MKKLFQKMIDKKTTEMKLAEEQKDENFMKTMFNKMILRK